MSEVKPDAVRAIERGESYPYHGLTAKDWAERGALGILADMSDRGGIKHALERVDEDVRPDIVEAFAAIIRRCNPTDTASEISQNREALLIDLRSKIQDLLDDLA